jgi:predicted amidohydrolase
MRQEDDVGIPVALVQLDAADDVAANVAAAVDLADEAASRGARLIALPESLQQRGSVAGYRASAAQVPGPVTDPFAALARRHRTWILLGSVAEPSADPWRPYNTSVLLAPDGTVAATYRKIHLFDVQVDDVTADRESDRATPGTSAVVADIDVAEPGSEPAGARDAAGTNAQAGAPSAAQRNPSGDPRRAAHRSHVRLGLTVCYDLRFPELYRALALAGAEVLCVPANFTERTGRDHWEVLLRARAIENGAYVLAPAQCGRPPSGPAAYGHSMVVDPWGIVVAQASDGPGLVFAELDPRRIAGARERLPMLAHRRPEAYRLDGA